jgi:electron transfer flavoprotein alpha subunit
VWARAPGPRQNSAELSGWGADGCVQFTGVSAAATASLAVAEWCAANQPWAVLAPGTMWGREVASRTAARIGAGLTGDAVELTVTNDQLVAWKPALGGEVVAAITATTAVQLVTVRPGVLPELRPRPHAPIVMEERLGSIPSRVRVVSTERDDELESLAAAQVVVAVGRGVAPDELSQFAALCRLLNAEIGATRKVTDAGWLPRARQIGITGRSVAPRLYLAFGVSGSLNHTAGVRGAKTVLAVNNDPSASIFDHADIGVVGDWHDVLPLLTSRLTELDAMALAEAAHP